MGAVNAAEFDRGIWRRRAKLVRLIDADTPVVLLDQGVNGSATIGLRLAGVKAAEAGTAAGDAATRWLEAFLEDRFVSVRSALASRDWPLRVETRRRASGTEIQSHERWVGDLWVVGMLGGELVDVAEALVAAGHAARVAA